MNLTKEYIAEQKKCINDNYRTHKSWEKIPRIKERYLTLKKFCEGAKKVLCLGSGGVEPIVIGATHAVDVDIIAGDLLRKQGWKGSFYVGSCDNLAAGWSMRGKFFDAAVCSEVIEHLPDIENVKKTFQELDRVAKKWIVTTPCIKINDPGHKRVFNPKMISECTQGIRIKLEKKDIYWYISSSPE